MTSHCALGSFQGDFDEVKSNKKKKQFYLTKSFLYRFKTRAALRMLLSSSVGSEVNILW